MEASIVISIIIAGGILGGFFMNYKQVQSLKKQQYDETLRKSMSDLYEVYRTDFNVKTKAECELLATRILDILAVLAKLNNKRIIDDDLLEFVEFDLEIAKGIMEWYDKEKLGNKYDPPESAKIWSNLTIYFEKHQVKVCKYDALPDCIQNYKNLK
jgi:hypothetical protein